MEKREHIVILAAGDFPTNPMPLLALREADFVVCCDSAYSTWKQHTLLSQPQAAARSPKLGREMPVAFRAEPSALAGDRREAVVEECDKKNFIVIGDGDSLSDNDKQQLGDRYIQVDEQDYNDLHKAMQWATSQFSILNSQFSIIGATGKRDDHMLGNISYLVTFAEEYPGIDIEMLTDHGRFVALHGSHTLPSFPKQQVSMFVLDPATSLTSSGLRWPLQDFHPRTWWQASLNEALEDNFTLTSTGWTILFQTYEPKG